MAQKLKLAIQDMEFTRCLHLSPGGRGKFTEIIAAKFGLEAKVAGN